ncbi:MAG: hypothetical protein R3C13_01065 [Hyphomonas sp.]|uniref:hypothetical protein n=1 Tax=Hyphomonas sp. TaxID=87 RepID=UPI00352761BA
MKGIDLVYMAPAIAFSGGLAGLMQHAAQPGDTVYLGTSLALFLIGIAAFAGLLLLTRSRIQKDD